MTAAESHVLLFDAKTFAKVRQFEGHADQIVYVVFSPDGKNLASIAWDQTVRVWNPATGEQKKSYSLTNGYPKSVAFSADGQRICAGSSSGEIYVWDMRSDALSILTEHKDEVGFLLAGKEPHTLISASADTTVKLWNLETGVVISTLSGHADAVKALALSSDGKTLLSGSQDTTMKVWNLTTGQELFPAQGHKKDISALFSSSDGRYLLSCGVDQSAKMWRVKDGKEMLSMRGDYESGAVAFSASNTYAAVGYFKEIWLWNLVTGEKIHKFEGHKNSVRWLYFTPEEDILYSSGWDGSIIRWDVKTGKILQEVVTENGIDCVALLASQNLLALGNWQGDVYLYEFSTLRKIHQFTAHTAMIFNLYFSEDGLELLTVGEEGQIKIWSTQDWKLLSTLAVKGLKKSAIVSHKSLLFAITEKKIEIFSWKMRTPVGVLSQTTQPLILHVSPDEKDIFVGNTNGTVFLYREKK